MQQVNESLGNYVGHQQTGRGVVVWAENAVLEAAVWADAVCRIRVGRSGPETGGSSYAVAAGPVDCGFEAAEQEEALEIRTRWYFLRIAKFPVRLSFHTPAGEEIHSDDPAFGISWLGGEITAYRRLQPGERFLGLGAKTGSLDRAGSACTNWNADRFAWPVDADPLYTSIPFFIGVHSGLCYGIFLDSTSRTVFNFGASNNRFSFFSAADDQMDFYFFHDEGVAAILRHYTRLTGRMPLPPLWSLGYHQCRFSYSPDHELRSVARGFRDRDIPCDVLYLDIHYMDGFRVFTWDAARFPDPAGLIADLRGMGFHVAAILDPGIKIEPGYGPYEEGLEQDVFLKYPDGAPYAGEVWPGWCHFPDFTSPRARRWWAERVEALAAAGVDGFWNDMNEPSAWGQHIPDLVEFDFEGKRASHKKGHNVYGMLMARSSREGACRHMGKRRPFVLTRSGFAGVQRYSAVWTGDNVSDDAHLFADIRMGNSLGLSGVAFCGCDIGGFAGECTPELFARWISLGVFTPLVRGHTMVDSRDAEPWSFGETVESIARNFIKLRYRLLPYIYSLFDDCARTGMPVARSLAIEDPHNPRIYDPACEHQYLFGPALLVVPAASADRVIRLYLPRGRWFDFYTDEAFDGDCEIYREVPLEKPAIFVRAGSVIPMQMPGSCTRDAPSGPLELHVYAGGENAGGFAYYEDDGESLDYEKGAFLRRLIRFSGKELVLGPVRGSFDSRFQTLKVLLHGFDPIPGIRLNAESVSLKAESVRFFEPVSPFSRDGNAADPYGELAVQTLEAPHLRTEMRFGIQDPPEP